MSDGWELNGTRVWAWAGSAFLLTLLCFALVGIKACTQRAWAFEDACRVAGGYVATLAQLGEGPVTPSSPTVCVKSIHPLVVIPVKP